MQKKTCNERGNVDDGGRMNNPNRKRGMESHDKT